MTILPDVPRHVLLAVLCVVLAQTSGLAGDAVKPVRIASGVSGHIHPAACV